MANIKKDKKYFFIYKTTNLVNEKYYFGMHSTNNLDDGYLGSGTYLWRSIRKYGKTNFKCEILEFCKSWDELAKREKELITEEILKDSLCMNLKPGGSGGWKNEEHRKKCFAAAMIAAKAGHHLKQTKWLKENDPKWVEWHRQRILKGVKNKNVRAFLGKHHKEESKKKIGKANSLKQQGNGNSQYGTCWITNGTENKKIKKDASIPEGWSKGRITKVL